MARDGKKGIIAEFAEFINRGNVMDLAVGVIIGGAFTAVVNSLVNNVIQPLISFLTGGTKGVPGLSIDLNGSVVDFSAFISAIINFLITAAAVFAIVKALNELNRIRDIATEKAGLAKQAEEDAKPTPPLLQAGDCRRRHALPALHLQARGIQEQRRVGDCADGLLGLAGVGHEEAHEHLLVRSGLWVDLLDAALDDVAVAKVEQKCQQLVLMRGNKPKLGALVIEGNGVRVMRVVGLGHEVEGHAGLELVEHKRAVPVLEAGDAKRGDVAGRFVHGGLPKTGPRRSGEATVAGRVVAGHRAPCG